MSSRAGQAPAIRRRELAEASNPSDSAPALRLAMARGRRVRFGIDRVVAEDRPRHRHGPAYATIVLSGSFEQSGYAGRYRLAAGDVLIQPTLDVHADRRLSTGLEIVRLPWPFDATNGRTVRVRELDLVRKAAERDVRDASAMLAELLVEGVPVQSLVENEADQLAAMLVSDPSSSISHWARTLDVSREGLSRLFRRTFGVCPAAYRGELRARSAWRHCLADPEPLAVLAAGTGFADQAHMTRAVRGLTGSSPGTWRKWAGDRTLENRASER